MRLMDILGKYDNFQDVYRRFEILLRMEDSIKEDMDEFLSSGLMELHPLDDIKYEDFEKIEGLLSDEFVKENIDPISNTFVEILKIMQQSIKATLDKSNKYFNIYNYNKAHSKVSDLISDLDGANLYDIYFTCHELFTSEKFKNIGLDLSNPAKSDIFKSFYNLEVALSGELQGIINTLEVREAE